MIQNSIEHNLNDYIRKIDDEGHFNLHNEKIRAEDFFRRLFELIYGWDSLDNLNYPEPNSPGIDLYESKKGIAIQVTAIQNNEKDKIETTIEKIFTYHKSKRINTIICFFIRNNKGLKNIDEKELSSKYDRRILIKTTRHLIGDFHKIRSKEKRMRIEEIIKQELSPKYFGLSNLSYFVPSDKLLTSSEYISPESAIWFSYSEKKKIKEISLLFNKNEIKEYCILGNPCSGKSTLAKAITNNLTPYYRKYTIDLSNPKLDLASRNLLEELNQLSYYHTIIIKLYHADQKNIVVQILNSDDTIKYIADIISGSVRDYEVYNLQEIFFHSFEKIEESKKSIYYNMFINHYTKNKLELYIPNDYFVYCNFLQLSSLLNLELGEIYKKIKNSEKVNTNSIVELTIRISKKRLSPETISRILNTFQFPEWQSMIEKLPTFSKFTNSLSELNTSPLSKKLLKGIINHIDFKQIEKKTEKQNIDQIGKSIRELESIDKSLGTNLAQNILDYLLEHTSFIENVENSNLSHFSKCMSDLSSIHPLLVERELYKSFANGNLLRKLKEEKSLSNICARILEINKIYFSDKKSEFFETIDNLFNSDRFQLLLFSENNVNSLLIFYELLKKDEFEIKKQTRNNLTIITEDIILQHDTDISLYTNTKILNIPKLHKKIKDSISSELINSQIKDNKFTKSEALISVLSSIDKKKTIFAFNNADKKILVNSMLHNENNIVQVSESLNRIRNNMLINNDLNTNALCSSLLDKYLAIQKTNRRKFKMLSFGGFIQGFYFALNINSDIALKHFESDFLLRLTQSNNKNLTVSSVFQFLRRLEEITKSKYKPQITEFLKSNKNVFVRSIRNEKLNDVSSGLVELSKCDLNWFSDEIFYSARKTIFSKIRQMKNESILRMKIIPELENVAIGKSKMTLLEMKTIVNEKKT